MPELRDRVESRSAVVNIRRCRIQALSSADWTRIEISRFANAQNSTGMHRVHIEITDEKKSPQLFPVKHSPCGRAKEERGTRGWEGGRRREGEREGEKI